MDFNQLYYTEAIAKTGSFTGAAELLYVSQSTVSSSIKRLEEELGRTIFLRDKGGAVLTPFGEEFLFYVQDVLDLTRYSPLLSGRNRQDERPLLSLASRGRTDFSLALAAWCKRQPPGSYRLRCYESREKNVMGLLSAGEIELAGYTLWSYRENEKERLATASPAMEFQVLDRQLPCVRCGPGSPLYDRSEDWVTLDMIRHQPLVTFYGTPDIQHFTGNTLLGRLGISLSDRALLSCSARGERDMLVEHTDALAVDSVGQALLHERHGQLRYLLIADAPKDLFCSVGVLKLAEHELSPAAQSFLKLYRELLAGGPEKLTIPSQG